jgi:Tetratricopeptide repeat
LVARPRVELETVFTRAFTLERALTRAALSVRLYRRGEVRVNGTAVVVAPGAAESWKVAHVVEVASLLRAGPNQIVVRASASAGPPAVWLALEGDGLALASDASWTSSLAGGTVKPARLATTPMSQWATPSAAPSRTAPTRIPSPRSALAQSAPQLLAFAVLSLGLVLVAGPWLVRRRPDRLLVLAAALAWGLLFWHDRALDFHFGFDADGHLQYIQYILDHGWLPLAHEGWEMYQPPLYYIIAALVVKLGGHARADAGAVVALRSLGYLAGVLQAVLVLASLRLLFPLRPARVYAGFVLAAALPMQLYLCQYMSNESGAALLGSASIYLALRILTRHDTSLGSHLGLGMTLGAAMLAKFSTLPVLAVVFVVLAGRLYRSGVRETRVWARSLGVTAATSLAVCGWHFARVALRFGNPFTGNWDLATGFHWWQDPGYHVPGDYLRFGASLSAPIFSAVHSFGDGLYSTLWGDGLVGGRSSSEPWPPWNYPLMSAGYLLALLPTAALVIGGVAAIWRLVREPRAEWFLLLGVLGSIVLGVTVMTLRIPVYAQIRAFYGASALVPACALGAWGLDLLATRARAPRTIVLALFGVWALNAYASFWAPAGAPWVLPPAHPIADDPDALTTRALAEQARGQPERALDSLRRAAALAPDSPGPYTLLASLHRERGEYGAAIAAAREALRARPVQPDVHTLLGDLYRLTDEREAALAHYETALRIQPHEARAVAGRTQVLAELGR